MRWARSDFASDVVDRRVKVTHFRHVPAGPVDVRDVPELLQPAVGVRTEGHQADHRLEGSALVLVRLGDLQDRLLPGVGLLVQGPGAEVLGELQARLDVRQQLAIAHLREHGLHGPDHRAHGHDHGLLVLGVEGLHEPAGVTTEGVGDTGPAMYVHLKMNGDDDWFYERIVVERWVDGAFKERSNFNYLGELGDDAGRHLAGPLWEDSWTSNQKSIVNIDETIYEQVWVADNRQSDEETEKTIKDSYSFSEEVLKQKMKEKSNGYEVSVETESEFFGTTVSTSATATGSTTQSNLDEHSKAKVRGREIEATLKVAPRTLQIRTIIAKVKGTQETRQFMGNNFLRWNFDPTTVYIAYDGVEVIHAGDQLTAEQQRVVSSASNNRVSLPPPRVTSNPPAPPQTLVPSQAQRIPSQGADVPVTNFTLTNDLALSVNITWLDGQGGDVQTDQPWIAPGNAFRVANGAKTYQSHWYAIHTTDGFKCSFSPRQGVTVKLSQLSACKL